MSYSRIGRTRKQEGALQLKRDPTLAAFRWLVTSGQWLANGDHENIRSCSRIILTSDNRNHLTMSFKVTSSIISAPIESQPQEVVILRALHASGRTI